MAAGQANRIANAEVHLRTGANGVFEPLEKTNTDAFGKFSFQHIPLDATIVFLQVPITREYIIRDSECDLMP